MNPDDKLCYCFHISRRKVVNFVKQTRPRRASQISNCFGAGTGCGWCIPFLTKIHREIVGDEIVEADDISAEEYEAMRASYREDVAAGERERNQYSGGGTEAGEAGSGDNGDDSDDGEDEYTRYFSRTRPPPEN